MLISTLYVSVLILNLFLGKPVCLHLYLKNRDCIYKYINHSSLFLSLAFDISEVCVWPEFLLSDWLNILCPFHFSIKVFFLYFETTQKNEKNTAITARRYECLSHTVLNWMVCSGGCIGATGTLLFVSRWGSNSKGLSQGLLVCVRAQYNRGEQCTAKVNKV